jgi:chromosome segregation ATPase
MDDLLVQLEEREAEIEGLEVNVQGLNIKLGDANTANLALRGQVAISEEQVSALLNVKQANEVELGKRASLIASLTKQLENMRSERDLDRNGFDEQLREKNLAIEQVKGSLADKIADNEQMDATVSQQTAKIKALESSLTHQKEIEEGFKHRLELADINKEKLESDLHTMESKMSTCLHDIQAGQDLVKLSKQDNVELRNGFMNWLGDTLSRLSFHAGSIEERKQVLNRYVKRLGNAIAVIQSSADDKQLLVEVLKSTIQVSARSSRPAETTLPMLHLLRLMEATPGKGGLSRKIWGELRDAGIKEFQSSALAGMVRSAEKEGSRLRAATVIDGIHTLLTGGEVMDDRESVLYPVLSGFVRHLLRHSRDSNSAGGEYTYVFTQKKLRRQIIGQCWSMIRMLLTNVDLKVQHPKAEAFLNSIITGKR